MKKSLLLTISGIAMLSIALLAQDQQPPPGGPGGPGMPGGRRGGRGQRPPPDLSKLPAPSDKKDLAFDKDIKSILDKNCFKCHGPEVQRPSGGLKLDTQANTVKGGRNTNDVVVGKSAASELVLMIGGAYGPRNMMPPPTNRDGTTNAPVATADVALIRAWIDQGAK